MVCSSWMSRFRMVCRYPADGSRCGADEIIGAGGGLNFFLFSWSIEYPTKPPKCTFSVSLTFCIYRGLWFLTRIRQVHTSAFSSQRLSFRYRVSLDLERRRSLETRDYHKADSSGHSGSARRPQPRIPGPGRCVQSL